MHASTFVLWLALSGVISTKPLAAKLNAPSLLLKRYPFRISLLHFGQISLPKSFEEQKQIGTFLDYLDHLITLHRRAYYNKKGGLTNVHNDNQQHYAIL